MNTATTAATGINTYATYLVPVEFDTGPAHVQLALVHHNDEVRINSIKFLSDALFK